MSHRSDRFYRSRSGPVAVGEILDEVLASGRFSPQAEEIREQLEKLRTPGLEAAPQLPLPLSMRWPTTVDQPTPIQRRGRDRRMRN